MAAEKKFGTRVFRCDKVPAVDGLKLLKRCSAILGPDGLAAIRDGVDGKRASEEFLVLATSPTVDATELSALLTDLTSLCTVKGDPCIIDVHIEGMGQLVEVAFWVMEVQFKDFLGVALASNDPGEKSPAV